jgi:cyclopropane fatty-acyl-phospholipid synthase-like methyltransferase
MFLALGIGRRTLSMRRAVWADGVETLPQAVEYVNSLIAAEAGGLAAAMSGRELRVLDIGCGVGGSLFFLAAAGLPMQGTGITISPKQAEIARRQARLRGLSARCDFVAADFSRMSGLAPFHLAFAIESYVHFPDPDSFFSSAAASLAPGGRLALVDDFMSRDGTAGSERRLIEAFRYGWVLPSLCPVAVAVRAAADNGMRLIADRDLSRRLATPVFGGRAGGRMARTMRALPVPGQYWRSTIGSLALASCQSAGLVEYRCLTFEKARP